MCPELDVPGVQTVVLLPTATSYCALLVSQAGAAFGLEHLEGSSLGIDHSLSETAGHSLPAEGLCSRVAYITSPVCSPI